MQRTARLPLVPREREGDARFHRSLVGDCYFRRTMRGQMADEAGGFGVCTAYISSAVAGARSGASGDVQSAAAEDFGQTWRLSPDDGSAVRAQQFFVV